MILALQFCQKDVFIAKELVRLIVEIEQANHLVNADLPFVLSAARNTNEFAIKEMEAELHRAFSKVIVIRGKRFGDGWPCGPNDLWFETMMRLQQMSKKLKDNWVLTFEPDCIPLRRDWIANLKRESIRCALTQNLGIGHLHNLPHTHINGNAIFRLDIVQKLNMNEGDGIGGWDVCNRAIMMPQVMDTDEIYQIYRLRYFRPEQSLTLLKNGRRPSLFHGIKGMLGIDAVRWMMQNGHYEKEPPPSDLPPVPPRADDHAVQSQVSSL